MATVAPELRSLAGKAYLPGLSKCRQALVALKRALHWRVYAARDRVLVRAAALRRRLLPKQVVFIGITGSAGKTTAKELLVAILSRGLQGRGSHITENRPEQVAKTIWKASRSDHFCVIELTATRPGVLGRGLALLRPTVGVVTTVGDDHISAFGSREAIAQEKGKLAGALPPHGTAVLNADDPLVLAMRSRCAGRVLTFGLSPDADVRAEQVRGAWPDRLRLTVVYRGEHVLLRTQLCGTHWVPAVLAAVATSLALGISLQQCARALADTPAFLARMQPVITDDGITFIRDDWKAPLWTAKAALEFMRDAHAARKIIVVGTLSDYRGDASMQYLRVARRALEITEHVVFVGPWASRVLRAAKDHADGRSPRAFSTVRQASDYLNSLFRPGDLVLLKGTTRKDHLYRIVLARSEQIQCWRDDCGRQAFCNKCRFRSTPSGPASADLAIAPAPSVIQPAALKQPTSVNGSTHVVIGLGNPGAKRVGTPHNIGHAVLDRLAGDLKSSWAQEGEALIGQGQWKGRSVCLVKLQTGVNNSGAAVRVLADQLGFGSSDCIIVHDDLDLPLGVVRTRMRGSAGGHRGVASILDAFQTDTFARVKVGIGRPDKRKNVTDYVLRPFPDSDRPVVTQACGVAAERVLSLM